MSEQLPIYEIQDALIRATGTGQRAVIAAPTGSGKSTQVPQMLLSMPGLDGQIVVMQPRRLAARLLARRVASERRSELGQEVGYQIRFDNATSSRTRIRFVTEGILLRQMLEDPNLTGVSAIIFDEFHERHLHGDVTLARALDLQQSARPGLKVIVMSATLDLDQLERYLAPCQVLVSDGRMFPVDIRYASTPAYADQRPVWDQAADAFADYVGGGGEGDLLIFMPGVFEIHQTLDALRRRAESRGFVLLPLHGELAAGDQDAAVAGYERRKVVVATNVAETSLTIPGIRCVIDSGLARVSRYDPHRGINTLLVEKISRASADQRAGRAGRTAPGVCLRLWSQEEHGFRPAQELPEIKRLDLSEVVLTLKAAGITNLAGFRWLETPDPAALEHAEELLADLGALHRPSGGTADSEITEMGRRMLAFPLHPRYGRMLLAAHDYGCVFEACLMAALTQGRDLLLRNVEERVVIQRENLAPNGGDFEFLLALWQTLEQQRFSPESCRRYGVHAAAARQVAPLFEQFLELARRQGFDAAPRHPASEALRKCILTAFSDRVGRRLEPGGARFELVHNRRGNLARESLVRESVLITAAEVREVEGKDKNVSTVLSLATPIQAEWLTELFPEDIAHQSRVWLDAASKRVYAEDQLQFRGLALGSKRMEPPPADEAARLLANEVLSGRLVLNDWDESVEQWIVRLNLLSKWCPELELPPLTPEDRQVLLEELCHGWFSFKEIKDRPVRNEVRNWLSSAQQMLLEKHAPERITLRNGRTSRVHYDPANPPHMAMRIQELFGVHSTPVIAMGRVPLLLHILAPSMRPVQITQDLAGFWRDHYPRIKQELQRKYPKHKWPDIP
jgi:ATP-dependent helicase HrpB